MSGQAKDLPVREAGQMRCYCGTYPASQMPFHTTTRGNNLGAGHRLWKECAGQV